MFSCVLFLFIGSVVSITKFIKMYIFGITLKVKIPHWNGIKLEILSRDMLELGKLGTMFFVSWLEIT